MNIMAIVETLADVTIGVVDFRKRRMVTATRYPSLLWLGMDGCLLIRSFISTRLSLAVLVNVLYEGNKGFMTGIVLTEI